MPGVSVQFHPNAFDTGKPLASFATNKTKARWTLAGHTESEPDVSANVSRKDYGLPLNPSHALVVLYGSPTTFETADEFNKLPYPEYRASIANAVERTILQVLDGTGSPATVTQIRAGTVA